MIQKLKDWFYHDDQEFFRREWRKAARWMRRPPGIYFVLLIFAVSFLPGVNPATLIFVIVFDPTPLSEWMIYLSVFGLAKRVLFLAVWIYLIQRFTIPPFQNERLIDLRLTLLSGREMWPALLAAPLLLIGLQSIFSLAAGYLFRVPMAIMKIGPFSISNDSLTGGMMFYLGLAPLFFSVSSLMLHAAVTAFAVQGALSKGGSMTRLLAWMFLGYVMVFGTLNGVLRIFVAFIEAFFSSNASVAAGIGLMYSVVYLLLSILIAFPIFRWSLRRLRSGAYWKGLLASQEIQG